jgi:toxin ParE1/3/4
MKLIVLPQAADEFEDAVAHYDDKQAGLGQRFRDEVDQHIRWIGGHADVPRLRRGGYRRVNLKVFPHYIAYLQIGDTVWILAIAHGHREPEYWIDRKGSLGQPGAPPNGGPARQSGGSGVSEGPPSVS